MIPAAKLAKVAPHLFHWSNYHEEWQVPFDSFAVATPAGVALVDPVMPSPPLSSQIRALGNPMAIYLTSASHERDAEKFRRDWKIQVYAHRDACGACEMNIDVPFMDGQSLPGEVQVVPLTGLSPGSVFFHSSLSGGIVLLGDALLHNPTKGLEYLPDQYCADAQAVKASLHKLTEWDFEVAGFAHGEPMAHNAKKRIASFLKNPINKTP